MAKIDCIRPGREDQPITDWLSRAPCLKSLDDATLIRHPIATANRYRLIWLAAWSMRRINRRGR
jgi:hypothetical protein